MKIIVITVIIAMGGLVDVCNNAFLDAVKMIYPPQNVSRCSDFLLRPKTVNTVFV